MKAREAKTVDQWRKEIDHDITGGRGGFRILPRELFNSPAFAALGGSATIVVLTILNKLEYEKKGQKDRKGVRTGHPILRNSGEFVLTINELVARGLKKSTATRARVRAWELGFFDVLNPGTFHHAGRYKYSERWRLYPAGDYRSEGQQPPGQNVYPESGFKKQENLETDSPAQKSNVIFLEHSKVARP
jgi:hypothetical protein